MKYITQQQQQQQRRRNKGQTKEQTLHDKINTYNSARIHDHKNGMDNDDPSQVAEAAAETSKPFRGGKSNMCIDNPLDGGEDNATVKNSPYGNHRSSSENTNIVPAVSIVQPSKASNYTQIASLNLNQLEWTIEARVVSKSQIRTWSNANGEGRLCNVTLIDNSMDMRAVLFNQAVDKFYEILCEGETYSFSGGKIKKANAKYNTCKSIYELTLYPDSQIHLLRYGNHNNITISKTQTFGDFVKVMDVESKEVNALVNILAIVKSVGKPIVFISRQSGKQLTKCELILIDDTNIEIPITLWGDMATRAPTEYHSRPIAAFYRARVSEYDGCKTLSLSGSADINPTDDFPEQVNTLQLWWSTANSAITDTKPSSSSVANRTYYSYSNRKYLSSIKVENIGNDNKCPDWIIFKGTISFIGKDKENGAWYPACMNSNEPCKNRYKVTKISPDQWYCRKCGLKSTNCTRRWLFNCIVRDDTGSSSALFFNEQAEKLLDGVTADYVFNNSKQEISYMNQDLYILTFTKAQYSEWIFKCKVEIDSFKKESAVKTTVYTIHPIDYIKESLDLLQAIEFF